LLDEYISLFPELGKRRQAATLRKSIEELKVFLNASSASDIVRLGRESPKDLVIGLQKWVNHLATQNMAPKTIRFRLYLVRSFLRFHDVEVGDRKLRLPKKGARRVDKLPAIYELQQLLLGTRSKRLRLLIHTLLLTGMRLSEALALRVEHIDLRQGFIHLPAEATKTGHARTIPIFSELREAIERYLTEEKLTRGYLFHVDGNPEKPIPKNRVYENYIELLKRLHLNHKTPDGGAYALHPHAFRKWFRTQLESAGVNKLMIDLWLGHNSGVEKVYYLPDNEMIQKEISKADSVMRVLTAAATGWGAEAAERMRLLEEIVAENTHLIIEGLILTDPEKAYQFLRRRPDLLRLYLEDDARRIGLKQVDLTREVNRILSSPDEFTNFAKAIILRNGYP